MIQGKLLVRFILVLFLFLITEKNGEKIIGHINEFNQLAVEYDTPENITMAKRASSAIQTMLDRNHTQIAVDLGCGTGLVGLELLDNFESMLFVDSSAKMIEQVEKKLEAVPGKKAVALCLDVEKEGELPYKVDTIILSLVLHHIEDSQQVLSKLYDSLNEGGQLLIVEMEKQGNPSGRHDHGIDRSALTKDLSKLGYSDIQSKVFYDGNLESDGQAAADRFVLSARRK